MQECNELPVEIISKISDELLEMGITAITLSGGEPFLHTGINRILKISKEKGIRITAISNGTCFHPDYMGILLTYGVCGSGCPGQAFSLYGTLYAITERCAERKVKLSNKLRRVFDSAVQLSQRQIE